MPDTENPSSNDSTKRKRSLLSWQTVTAIGLLALMAVLASGPALFRESPTFDEIAHIAASITYVNKFDARFNPEHPPLAKLLSGIFMAIGGVRADYRSPLWVQSASTYASFTGEWVFGDWVALRWNDPHKVIFWARLPMLLLTLLLGWCIYAFATRLGGSWAGLLCLAIYASTPTFLTFGPLVLTDIPITLAAVLTIWTFASLWQSPTRSNFRCFTLCLAIAFLTKFSSVLVLFSIVVAAFTTRWAPKLAQATGQPLSPRERKTWRRQRWVARTKAVLLAWLVSYVFGLVISWNQNSDALARLGTSIPALVIRRLLIPVVNFGLGAFFVFAPTRPPVFLMGHFFPHGTVLFFPTLLLLKSLPGFLALLLVTAGLALWARRADQKTDSPALLPSRYAMHWRIWWLTLLVYSAVCLVSHFDVSIRHFAIPIALSIVLLAPLPNLIARLRNVRRGTSAVIRSIAVALAVSCLATAVLHYPWYMPYANFLAGGRPPYDLFSDSNADWNQGLFAVEDFARSHNLQRVPLDYYGSSEPEPIVPQAVIWNCQNPSDADAGEWAVVSSNVIHDAENCGWLLQYPNQAIAGGSMYAFHLPSPIPRPGTVGGPPLPAQQKPLFSFGGPEDQPGFREMMVAIDRTPSGLGAFVQKQMEAYQRQAQQQRKQR